MTEQNYADPGQNQSEPPATTTTALLERISKLEAQVAELQQKLALSQGGVSQSLEPPYGSEPA